MDTISTARESILSSVLASTKIALFDVAIHVNRGATKNPPTISFLCTLRNNAINLDCSTFKKSYRTSRSTEYGKISAAPD